LPSFFDCLQRADPSGIYYLESDLLSNHGSYDVTGAPEGSVYFKSYIVIPSAAIQFFRNSRKIATVDGAHMYSKMGGVMLTFNVKDASDSIIPLGVAYVNIENSKNWSLFYDCIINIFSDLLLIISDKDKGLNSLRVFTNAMARIRQLESEIPQLQAAIDPIPINLSESTSSTPNDVSKPVLESLLWSICSVHVLKNSNTQTDNLKYATSLAKAPTEETYQYYLNIIKSKVSPAVANALDKRKEEFSFVVQQSRGLKTNLGEVTSNAVESTNWSFSTFRSLGPIDGILCYLLNLFSPKFVNGSTSSIKLRDENNLVHPIHVQAVTDLMTRFPNWKSSITSIDFSKLIVRVAVSNAGKLFPVTLCADLNKDIEWFYRVSCECGYTKMLGRPCLHGAHALMEINRCIMNLTYKLILKQWHYAMPHWYHPAFHINSYVDQYQGIEVKLPNVDVDSLQCHAFYPPFIVKPKGRPPTHRMTPATASAKRKRDSTSSITSSVANVMSDDDDGFVYAQIEGEEPSEYDLDSSSLPKNHQTSTVSTTIREKCCGCCGQPGHDANNCSDKSSVYIVKHYSEGKKIKGYPIVPIDLLDRLSSKNWSDIEIGSVNSDDDEVDDAPLILSIKRRNRANQSDETSEH